MASETTATEGGHVSPLSLEEIGQCVDSHGGAVGMPQLCGEWMGNQIFWLLVTLVVIFLILSKIALPRIGAILAERQGAITNDLATAEDLKAKAVEAEAAYNQALADARVEAQNIAAANKAEIKKELDLATAEADREISARAAEGEKRISEIKASAMASVGEVSQDVAEALVAAMGGKADATSIKAAVAARLKG